jgi:hypothetical protein
MGQVSISKYTQAFVSCLLQFIVKTITTLEQIQNVYFSEKCTFKIMYILALGTVNRCSRILNTLAVFIIFYYNCTETYTYIKSDSE